MDHVDDWDLYNQKNKISAKEYVDDNLFRLIRFFDFEDESGEEEKKQVLIDYFTKYPDQITSINIQTVGKPNQLSVPSLNNIGGVIKYR
jgi:hypothetical protein